jgi:uncharacterized membrane protein
MNSASAAIPLWATELVPAIVTLAGVFIVLVCRPLIAGKIAPNRLYGIRTPLAFSSDENWYRINRIGGMMLCKAGVFIAAVGLAGFLIAPLVGMVAYNLIATGLVLAAILGTAVRILLLR